MKLKKEVVEDPRREEIAEELIERLIEMAAMQKAMATAVTELSYHMQEKFGLLQEQIDDIANPDAPKVCYNPDWKPGDPLP